MAIISKPREINATIDSLGRMSHDVRVQLEGFLNSEFELNGRDGLVPKPGSGVGGTARERALSLKTELEKASHRQPPELDGPLGGEKAPVSGVSPVPVNIPAKASYQPGNPERAIADASRAAMPSGFSWDGR